MICNHWRSTCSGLLLSLLVSTGHFSFCQKLKPGLPGMAPSRWITIKNTQAPGRSYKALGSAAKAYSQEDLYFKAWIPVVHNPKFTAMLGPQYRTEQLEFKDQGENPLHLLSNWNLRSWGVDVLSCITVDSAAWLLTNLNINQSGNLHSQPSNNVPMNYTLSAVYIKKKSVNSEMGFGIMANRSFNRIVILPVFVYNFNYSSKAGLEMSLPRKISWRHNLSSSDIVYVKTEAISRSYFIKGYDVACEFRRTELDMGVAYNKQFSRLIGAEVFGGYRRNINTRLPGEVTAQKASGFVFTFELYFRSPMK